MYSSQDLAVLVAIADTGSLRGAAMLMGRTQPAITQAIRRLENAVGFPLLDRSGYRARLTDRGEAFVRRARLAVIQGRSLRAFADLLARGAEPRIRLAVHGAIPIGCWVDLVKDVPLHFPDTAVEVEAGEGNAPLRRLLEGEAHLALLLQPFPDRYAAGVEYKTLGTVEYVNVVRQDRAERLQQQGDLGLPQILAADFDDLTTSYAVTEDQRFWRVSDHRMKAAAILAGAGWGYVPRSIVEDELRNGTLQALPHRGRAERGVRPFALYRKRGLGSGPVAAFIWDSQQDTESDETV